MARAYPRAYRYIAANSHRYRTQNWLMIDTTARSYVCTGNAVTHPVSQVPSRATVSVELVNRLLEEDEVTRARRPRRGERDT